MKKGHASFKVNYNDQYVDDILLPQHAPQAYALEEAFRVVSRVLGMLTSELHGRVIDTTRTINVYS